MNPLILCRLVWMYLKDGRFLTAREPSRWTFQGNKVLEQHTVDQRGDENYHWKNVSRIDKWVYLGSSHIAASLDLLHQLRIKTIINATCEVPCYHKHEPDLNYVQLGWFDDTDQEIGAQELEQIYQYIQDRKLKHPNSRILIHCYAGKSRSVSVALYYLCRSQACSLQQGFTKLWTIRPVIAINDNFMKAIACALEKHP